MSCLKLEISRASIGNRKFSMIYFVVSSLLSLMNFKKFIMICVSHYVRKSKTVLDSGFYAVDSRFQVFNFRFLVSGTWISDFNR